MPRVACLIALAVILAAGLARARPPDKLVLMAKDGHRFERAPLGDWTAHSLDEKVLKVRVFEPAEVFLEPVSAGRTHVLLHNRVIGQVKIWLVRVSDGAEPPGPVRPDPAALEEPCGCGAYPLHCQLKDKRCLSALQAFLEDADLTTADVGVRFSVEGLQAVLKDLADHLKKAGFPAVELTFHGANLRLSGQVADQAAWRKLVVAIYERMVGKLIIEDKLKRADSP
jgi:hypothetical protein